MPFRIDNKSSLRLSVGSALALGALVSLLLTVSTVLRYQERMSEQLFAHYGQALASMAAKQSIDAAFNSDLIRLQLILQDVLALPHVQMARMHDVENNLLVQAGEVAQGSQSNPIAFTAPVVLHDSLAGIITIDLKSTLPGANRVSFIIFCAVLVLFAVVCAYFYREKTLWFDLSWIKDHSQEAQETQEREADLMHDATEGSVSLKEASKKDKRTVCMIIHLKNRKVLAQQLNGEAYRRTCAQFESVLSDVLALYGGVNFEDFENHYVLRFNAEDAMGEALFRAICSAHIILELASIINNIPLDLAAFVSANPDDMEPTVLPFAGLVVEPVAAEDEVLQRRLVFMEVGSDDGRKVVSGFKQPFASLLSKQRQQLDRLLSA